jgi:hypothetical protein
MISDKIPLLRAYFFIALLIRSESFRKIMGMSPDQKTREPGRQMTALKNTDRENRVFLVGG